MTDKTYDLIVIGTGTAASVTAFNCRKAGWSVAIIDHRPFGGTCARRGCDPKKMLIAAAERGKGRFNQKAETGFVIVLVLLIQTTYVE